MLVLRHFALRQSVELLAAGLAEGETASHVNRHAAPQIGQRERRLSVAAERRAEKGEKRLVLIDRQELPVAKSPTLGRKVPTDDLDLTHKWCSHRDTSFSFSLSKRFRVGLRGLLLDLLRCDASTVSKWRCRIGHHDFAETT